MGKRPFTWRADFGNYKSRAYEHYASAEARNERVARTLGFFPDAVLEIRDSPNQPWRPYKESVK
jgi:hypothetical protein